VLGAAVKSVAIEAIEISISLWACKAIEAWFARRASVAIKVAPTRLGAAHISMVFEVLPTGRARVAIELATTFGRSGESWRVGTAAAFEACAPGRAVWPPALRSCTAVCLHVFFHLLMDTLGQFHELVFTEFAVFVLVELGEHFLGARQLRSASFRAARARPAFALAALAAHLFHFLARFGAFVVAELAVLVGVEFLEHLFAHFSALAVAFFAVLFGRLGDGRQREQACRDQCETWDEIPHVRSFPTDVGR
jgi:hypothetical protein